MAVSICRDCKFEHEDCKGYKDLEKIKCNYFKPLYEPEEESDELVDFFMNYKKMCTTLNCERCELFGNDQRCLCDIEFTEITKEDIERMRNAVENFKTADPPPVKLVDGNYIIDQLNRLKEVFVTLGMKDSEYCCGIICGISYAIGGIQDVMLNGSDKE